MTAEETEIGEAGEAEEDGEDGAPELPEFSERLGNPVPVLEDVAARLRELLCRMEGAEDFIDYAAPLLAAVERNEQHQHDDRTGHRGNEAAPWGNDAALSTGPQATPELPEPLFPHAVAWVEGWFLPTFRRKAGGSNSRWCAQWWAHAEALTRFEALWRSWEVLRLDPGTGLATWLRDHLDPQLAHLMDADGPFAQCAPDRHEPLPRLVSQTVPEAVLAELDRP